MAASNIDAPVPTLTEEQAREMAEALMEVVQKEENKTRLTQARAMAGDDPKDPALPMKLMMMCMPLIVGMIGPTLTKYGFAADQGGLMQALMQIRGFADDTLKEKVKEIIEEFLPPELSAMFAPMAMNAMQK